MLKMFDFKYYFVVLILGLLTTIILIIKYEFNAEVISKLGFLNISCKAYGNIYINGYNFQYVENYRFYKSKRGNFAISGKIFDREKFLGIVGLKTAFTYNYSDGMITMKTKDSIVQVDNSIGKDVLLNVIPGAFLNTNTTQLIVLYSIGDGYRVDYNTHPTAYCY